MRSTYEVWFVPDVPDPCRCTALETESLLEAMEKFEALKRQQYRVWIVRSETMMEHAP